MTRDEEIVRRKPIADIDLPVGQCLRQYKAGGWYQLFDDDRYILCRGFMFVCYSGPGGAEAFVHDLKRFVGAK